ncbi:MAG: 5'/3'-nucleotidase SurE [Candidatus Omnitrophica bacterium]|nr:5'/3'-nucleotidase SurE [Candidatus Omnitrophota bacterium]
MAKKKPRILLVNDDGVYAAGIAAMYHELVKIGDVTVVAPESERSSISQAITLYQPLYHKRVSVRKEFSAHAMSGTPADCVKFGVSMILKKKPDLVVSGVNDGCNDGCSIFYSGTVGAAREGALMGIPSIAISLDSFGATCFQHAAQVGVMMARWVLSHRLSRGTFLNINVPDIDLKKIKGIRWTRQCKVPIHGEFKKKRAPSGKTYYWLTGRPPAGKNERQSDSYLLKKGYVVVAPIHCDATDHDFLRSVKGSIFL